MCTRSLQCIFESSWNLENIYLDTALKVHLFVTSRLDSNHAILYNIPSCHPQKLGAELDSEGYIGRGKVRWSVSSSERAALAACNETNFLCCVTVARITVLLGTSLPNYPTLHIMTYCDANLRSGRDVLKLLVPIDCGVTTAPFPLQYLTSGMICTSEPEPVPSVNIFKF